jgi:hypothetical protein
MARQLTAIRADVITTGYPKQKINKLHSTAMAAAREAADTRTLREKYTRDIPVGKQPEAYQQYLKERKLRGLDE